MKRTVIVIAAALMMSFLTHARDAAQLRADLLGIIPASTKIRLAYIKSATPGFQAFAMMATKTTIYVVDSDDGEIRQLYPTGASNYNIYNVCLTADGRKVMFWNKSTGQMGVIGFDGGTVTWINSGSEMTESWRNPDDGSDWGVLLNGNRINIDTKQIHNNGVSGVNIGSAPTGLSDDGKYLLFQNTAGSGGFGFYEIATKTYTARSGGCQPSMRPGNSYQFNINPSGHGAMTVYSLNSTQPVRYETAQGATTFITSKGQNATAFTCKNDHPAQEGTRFTQHPDYATFFLSNSKANPILARISDMKFAYIEDNLSSCFFIGDMDAVILPVGTSNRSSLARTAAQHVSGGKVSSAYSFDGRRMSPSSVSRYTGVLISEGVAGRARIVGNRP